jgi:hypothetical protein
MFAMLNYWEHIITPKYTHMIMNVHCPYEETNTEI